MIWYESISLGQKCNTTHFIYFSKHLENIRVSYLPYIHDLKNQIESLTEEVTQLLRANKE